MFKSESSSLLEDFQVYGNSKLANILFTAHLHTRVAPYDITTYTVHPGEAVRRLFKIYQDQSHQSPIPL